MTISKLVAFMSLRHKEKEGVYIPVKMTSASA